MPSCDPERVRFTREMVRVSVTVAFVTMVVLTPPPLASAFSAPALPSRKKMTPLSIIFSATADAESAVQRGSGDEYTQDVYWNQYTEGQELDQAAFTSSKFWEQVDQAIPLWQTAPKYARFRGFCDNLRHGVPGEVTERNSQQLLTQYIFPGLDHGDVPESGNKKKKRKPVIRSPYPAENYAELQQLQAALARDVSPVARRELAALLDAKPLVGDDDKPKEFGDDVLAAALASASADSAQGETWQRAAWYGWQFLSLRGAKRQMPETTAALTKALGDYGGGPAHRFVGLARQKAGCIGVEHSDHRNYMLSTLTPVLTPEGYNDDGKAYCGIVVGGRSADIGMETQPIILDNTFVHHVYNHHDAQDRFCLMTECYHPDLTKAERDAIGTLFAVKDRFTVQELRLAPWGYDDDDLSEAMSSGAVNELEFWRDIGYVHVDKAMDRRGVSSARKGGRSSAKSRKGGGGFGKK